jgi:BlaI family transcriptional regulator, penicillinase repressor
MASMERLSRRERQIMEIMYRLGSATVADVLKELTDDVSYSTVRAQLRILEEKGHLRHEEKDLRYVYMPVVAREKVRRSALRSVIDTFFGGSAEEMVAALLDHSSTRLSDDELDRLALLIEKARKDGR